MRRLRMLRASFGDMRRRRPIPNWMADPGKVRAPPKIILQ
jgi:hypothetical protein